MDLWSDPIQGSFLYSYASKGSDADRGHKSYAAWTCWYEENNELCMTSETSWDQKVYARSFSTASQSQQDQAVPPCMFSWWYPDVILLFSPQLLWTPHQCAQTSYWERAEAKTTAQNSIRLPLIIEPILKPNSESTADEAVMLPLLKYLTENNIRHTLGLGYMGT